MATAAAITLEGWGAARNLQALYTAEDANELTIVTVRNCMSVRIFNRTGATLLVQTQGAVQEAAPASDAAQVLQASEMTVLAADCGASPFSSWSFGLASAGLAVADLTATVL